MGIPDSQGAEGYVIGGKYRLTGCIGVGGMGSIWRAEHIVLNAPVAIKLIDPHLLCRDDVDPREVLNRFLREARAAAALRSPHVVQLLDYGLEGQIPFMALELLDGESLEARLHHQPVLPYAMAARIVTHVARALTRAHEAGLMHRDLKPSNIFLVRNDDEEVAKVLDFGLVKATGVQRPPTMSDTTGTHIIGTPYYMSPEQIQGKAIDHRTDLWALGVITFECVCGQAPFHTEQPGDLLLEICVKPMPVPSRIAAVPPGFDEWFARATARDAAKRFQSAREMADALRAVLAPEESLPRFSLAADGSAQRAPGPPAAPAARPAALAESGDKTTLVLSRDASQAFFRTRRRLAVTLVAVLAAAAAGVILMVSLMSGPREPSPAAEPAETSAPSASVPAPSAVPAPEVPTGAPAPTEAAEPTARPAGSARPTGGGSKRVDPRLGF
jgi:serine/threonine-protein kinase